MKRGLLCVEMVIIMFLGNIGSDYFDDLPSSCPRDKSRLVKNIVDKKILPIFDRYRIEMPIECPFHPHRDVLWWPEDNLSAFIFTQPESGERTSSTSSSSSSGFSVTSITETFASFFTSIWRCPLCNQIFTCSESLASHWDVEHRLYRHRTENFVCLSDFCDLMRCDVLSRRRIYPTIGGSKYLARVLSPTLSVSPVNLPPPSSSLPIPPGPENCNQTEMNDLEKRCQIVVRQCLLPLLVDKITVKDFRDMEEDMVKETCGYLNCDKFWDLTIHVDRTRPLSLCVLFGIIMIGGFLICYYIVWTLLESTIGLKQERFKQMKVIQLKGNRQTSFPTPVSNTATATTVDKQPAILSSTGSLLKKRLSQGQSLSQSSSCQNASTNAHRRYGESETSQEDNSPASSESRYIVTHSGGNSRRYQRPSHLYLASELALLLEKRSMETVPESSDDQGSISLTSQSVSTPPPFTNKPSSSSSGVTRSNVSTITSRQANDSQTSQGASRDGSRQSKDSSQSTASIQETSSSTSHQQRVQHYHSRRRDFAFNGRRNRYEDDDYDDDDTDELMVTMVARGARSHSIIKSSPSPPTTLTARPIYGGTMSDSEIRRSDTCSSGLRPSTGGCLGRREMRNEVRNWEANLNKPLRSANRSLHRVSYSIGNNDTKRDYDRVDRDSSASDTVTSIGPGVESEPVVSSTSGRRFSRPGIVRSISSSGAIKRVAMVSHRYSSQPTPTSSTTAAITAKARASVDVQSQSRSSLIKSRSSPVDTIRPPSNPSTYNR